MTGYHTDCDHDDCDRSGVVPRPDESVVRGTRIWRTQTEEYERLAGQSRFAETPQERRAAEQKLEYTAEWEHYCPRHAAEQGIAPSINGGD